LDLMGHGFIGTCGTWFYWDLDLMGRGFKWPWIYLDFILVELVSWSYWDLDLVGLGFRGICIYWDLDLMKLGFIRTWTYWDLDLFELGSIGFALFGADAIGRCRLLSMI
jgi:hypothetical protein